jgi:hypothetical protein
MASDANSPWAHLVQDTAGPTPFSSGIQVTLPNSQFVCPQNCKMVKTAPPMQTTYQFILIKHSSHFGQNHGTAAIHRQRQTIPCHQVYCLQFNFCGNCPRTHQDTSNQAQALPHTTQNSPQSYITSSEAIAVPPPSTDNTKGSLTTRLIRAPLGARAYP